MKSCMIKSSNLAAVFLLNKKTPSINSAFNSIIPSRWLQKIKLDKKIK